MPDSTSTGAYARRVATSTGQLVSLAPGLYVWQSHQSTKGHPNAGVIVDTDGVTLVDTLMVPEQYDQLGEVLDGWGLPLRRLVLTSSHIDLVGGTRRFWMAACYGSQQISDRLDLPPNVDGYRAMMPEFAASFPDDLRTRPVSHLITQAARITDAAVIHPTRGQIDENLVVTAPAADVVFAGAMACFGTTPLAFDGDPAAWADELDLMAELGTTVVPAYGPVGDRQDLADLAAYLRACVAADGDITALGSGPWDGWTDRQFDAVNIERAAMMGAGNDAVPPSMLTLLGLA